MGLKEFLLEGKAAVVIGAEHAVGRAAAAALAEAGAKILLASQEPGTEKQLKETAKAIGASGAKVSIRVQTRRDARRFERDRRARGQGTRQRSTSWSMRSMRHFTRPPMRPTIPPSTRLSKVI